MHLFLSAILPAIVACIITLLVIPCWISVCQKWQLFESNDDRKRHRYIVPTMGGLAIFAGIMIPFLFLGNDLSGNTTHYLIGSSLILFFTGFFDDLIDLPARRKLLLQFIAAFFIAFGGIRITSLCGLFDIYEIPDILSIPLTMLFITGVTNAYNLIDGLDGLAGSLGLMASFILGVLLYTNGHEDFGVLSFCMTGALLGFLRYNFHPAKIFMGDTGSLVLGFLLSSQSVLLITTPAASITNIPLLVITVLFIPVYDVVRVTVIRLLTGQSPFKADRNHVHHMIYSCGFGQRSTTLLIVAINSGFMALALLFPNMNINLFIVLCMCLGMLMLNVRFMTATAWFYGRIGGRLHSPSVPLG